MKFCFLVCSLFLFCSTSWTSFRNTSVMIYWTDATALDRIYPSVLSPSVSDVYWLTWQGLSIGLSSNVYLSGWLCLYKNTASVLLPCAWTRHALSRAAGIDRARCACYTSCWLNHDCLFNCHWQNVAQTPKRSSMQECSWRPPAGQRFKRI